MNTNKLMEMYNSTFQPALAEGSYKVHMKSHEYVANENGASKKPYIKFVFEDVETGRLINENRFNQGFGVMVSHLRQQLGRENEAVQPKEFFDELINNKTDITIWVVKRMVNGAQKTNVHFLEPLPDTAPNTTVVEDEVE